jgi:hypothetical protein
MRKIKEQIDYGNQPERMDPNLERKLGDPEGLYAKNPAMRKGVEDVQRLISSRFQKVTDKLKQVTGNRDLTSRQVQQMVYMEMMSKVPQVMGIEDRHKDELEQLAVEACLEETETAPDWYKIEPYLNRVPIDVSNFRYQEEEPEDEEEKPEKPQIPSFDVEDLTDEEQLELEKHKRNIINAIIQGAAKKGHYIFQKPEVKARLDAINPSLYQSYLGIMAINDFMYFSMEQMIEMMSQTGQGVAGKVELGDNDDDEDEGGEGEEKPDTVIKAYGLIFPILCHEIIKGIEEGKGRHGLPQDQGMREKVLGQTDVLHHEPMQLRIGPEIVEKLRFALPDEMFDESNKGLINWFHILLYQIPAQEFLKIMGDVISADQAKNKKATQRFEEIMREAINMKEEYDNYKEEKGEEPSDDTDEDDDDLDDFLSGLGISRPK